MLQKNAKIVLIGSLELGERIHTHMIATNAEVRPKKPQSPRLYGLKKDVIAHYYVITQATLYSNAIVNRPGTLLLIS